jgi:mRNA interferase MazF
MEVDRFDVFLVTLDPAQGSGIQKTRSCVVISPNEMNHNIRTVIIAPMTSKSKPYPTRANCTFKGTSGQIVLDQIRTVDQSRFVKKLGSISTKTSLLVLDILSELFAE